MAQTMLEVKNLKTYFNTPEGIVRSVDGVSFHINKGETLALVGESGCGKTVTSLSLIRLLANTANVEAEVLKVDGNDISNLTKEQARLIRGKDISMIFQEPMTSLNPVLKIRRQIGEVFMTHFPELSKQEIAMRSIEVLERVGVPNPIERLDVYPHQLSGGLRQRIMIAISLASSPKVLIADEPTTALDVTIQAQIIDLLKDLQAKEQMSMLLITHDFGVVSQLADRVAVMYAGRIVEYAPLSEIFTNPLHPYTEMLINSIPGIRIQRGSRLESIKGAVPNPLRFPQGCRFHPRCTKAMDICKREIPSVYSQGEHDVACWLRGGHNEQ